MVGRVVLSAALMSMCGAMCAADAAAQAFGGPTFAYGNAGYAAGYSIAGVRGFGSGCGSWSGGGVCGPWWRGGCRVGGWPDCGGGGWGFGWPGLGFGGCMGSARWGWSESTYLSVAPGGGVTFFSGRQVPFVTGMVPIVGGWPTNWYPAYPMGAWGWYPYAVPAPIGVGPQFGPAGVLPFLGASAAGRPAFGTVAAAASAEPAPIAVVRSRPAARVVTAAARRRAERLVASGDGHLRAARADAPARVRAALDAYRRAANAAPDDPDIRVREALALVALGDPAGADKALARAVAIDGRLAAGPPPRGKLPADPVLGGRPADAPAPLAVRGSAILREIGAADAAGVEWLAARWVDRWVDRWGDRWGGGAAAAVARR